MRKAGLLDKKPLTATRTMLDTARKDTGTLKTVHTCYSTYDYIEYETQFYFRAAVSEDTKILEKGPCIWQQGAALPHFP